MIPGTCCSKFGQWNPAYKWRQYPLDKYHQNLLRNPVDCDLSNLRTTGTSSYYGGASAREARQRMTIGKENW